MRRWALITAVGLVLASHAQVRAQAPLPLALDWKAPAECPREADVRAELARITRVRPGHTLTPLVASAEVERVGQGYATLLRTERAGNRGERKLEALDCGTLVRTVTLVLALAFGSGVELTEHAGTDGERLGADPAARAPVASRAADASAAEPTAETAQTPATASSVASEPSNPDQDASEAGSAASADLELAFVLGGGAQLGPLPAPGLGLIAGAALVRGAFALELRALAWPTLARAQSADVSARFDGFGGAALGCGLLPQGPITLALCAGARAAALRGRSSGASDDAAATAPWYALSAAGALSWPRAGLLRMRLEATLSVSLARPYFVIEGLGRAHQIPRLAPELALLLVLAP